MKVDTAGGGDCTRLSRAAEITNRGNLSCDSRDHLMSSLVLVIDKTPYTVVYGVLSRSSVRSLLRGQKRPSLQAF